MQGKSPVVWYIGKRRSERKRALYVHLGVLPINLSMMVKQKERGEKGWRYTLGLVPTKTGKIATVPSGSLFSLIKASSISSSTLSDEFGALARILSHENSDIWWKINKFHPVFNSSRDTNKMITLDCFNPISKLWRQSRACGRQFESRKTFVPGLFNSISLKSLFAIALSEATL